MAQFRPKTTGYEFSVILEPGNRNRVADYLSRSPRPGDMVDDGEEFDDITCLAVHQLPPRLGPLLGDHEWSAIPVNEFREAQQNDQYCQGLLKTKGIVGLEGNEDGILVRISPRDGSVQNLSQKCFFNAY